MLGVYNYTVILTYIGMLSGFSGILCAFEGNVVWAIVCLMISGVCDMFDGKVASTKQERSRSEKRFGIQIDSLSDLVCFGVLPAVIVYSLGRGTWLRAAGCALYVLCALIRLAWYNVDEEARQDFDTGRRKVYLGLPVSGPARDQRGPGVPPALRPLRSIPLAHRAPVHFRIAPGGGGLLDPLLHPQALPVRAPQAQAAGVPSAPAEEEKRCRVLKTTAPSASSTARPWAGAC